MDKVYDHEAIIKAYEGTAIWIRDGEGVFLVSDNSPFEYDQAKVDAARVELDKLAYRYYREREYPDCGSQLDYIYHNGIEKWKTDIVDPVKQKYPKPE